MSAVAKLSIGLLCPAESAAWASFLFANVSDVAVTVLIDVTDNPAFLFLTLCVPLRKRFSIADIAVRFNILERLHLPPCKIRSGFSILQGVIERFNFPSICSTATILASQVDVKPVRFSLERRLGIPYNEHVFYSIAPLHTQDHLKLLMDLESLSATASLTHRTRSLVWIVFGGLEMAFGWVIAAVITAITIIDYWPTLGQGCQHRRLHAAPLRPKGGVAGRICRHRGCRQGTTWSSRQHR